MLNEFKELFGHVETNVNIEFILAILGIVLGLISLRPKQIKKKKKIEVKQADNDLLIKIPLQYSESIKVLFDDEVMSNLYELTVYLKNSGVEVLKFEDFHKECSIKFGRDVNLKLAELRSNDEFTKASITSRNQSVEIKIDLLEQNKYLKANILYESEVKVDVKFESNIVGGERLRSDLELYNRMHHSLGESKDSNAWFPISIFLGGIIWIIELFIVENSLGINVFDNDFKVIIPHGWFTLFFIIPLLVTIKLFKVLHFNRQSWLKIKDWKDVNTPLSQV